MITYSAAFVIAMLTALLGTPIAGKLAEKLGAVSEPGGRNINNTAIPRLGGLAIALAVSVAIGALLLTGTEVARLLHLQIDHVLGLSIGALAMCALGAVDDVHPIPAKYKLLFQVLLAAFAYQTGIKMEAVSIPFWGVLQLGAWSFPLTILWIVGVTNAVNLIDGLDGLAAGVAFCAAGTTLVVAAFGQQVLVATVMAALMGALFGFLFFNFNPARIFMGDSGSYFLGFTIATSSIIGNLKASAAVSMVVPVLALGLPLFDTLFSIARRAALGRPLFEADRGHIHHLLLEVGLTHRRAVLILYGVSLLFAAAAIVVSIGRDWQLGLALVVALSLIAGLVRFASHFSVARISTGAPSKGQQDAWIMLAEGLARTLFHHDCFNTESTGAAVAHLVRDCEFLDAKLFIEPEAPVVSSSQSQIVSSVDGRVHLVLERDDEVPRSVEAVALLTLAVNYIARAQESASSNP